MRSRFPSLLFPAITTLILSACATTGGDAPAPASVQVPALPAAVVQPSQDATDLVSSSAPAQASVAETPVAEAAPLQPEPVAAVVVPSAPAPAPATVPPVREAPPASPFLFNIVSETKDASHPYYGVGHRMGFAANGVQGKPLVLVRGKTYRFSVDAGIQHDFYISSSEVGWGAATYAEGVSGQFIYEGVVTFTPGAQAPDLLYYQCRNHKNMGGPMYIVNEGQENLSIAELRAARGGKGPAASAADPQADQQRNVTEQQIQQKLQFADMFINQSPAAGRIRDSGNETALGLYRDAQQNFQQARSALTAGRQRMRCVWSRCHAPDERVFPQVPQNRGEAERARFQEMYEGVQGFEAQPAPYEMVRTRASATCVRSI